MSRLALAAAAFAIVGGYASAVLAQGQPPGPPPAPPPPGVAVAQPFVAHATVSVQNNSPVPQTVSGTNVPPFQLPPQQQAELDMTSVPPPALAAPGSSVPVQFNYNVGQTSGPQCHGTIDMSLHTQGAADNTYQVTNCVSHSLGTDGANCQIAVKANNGACQGALAFTAP